MATSASASGSLDDPSRDDDDDQEEDFPYYYEDDYDHDSPECIDSKPDREYFDFQCMSVADVERLLNENVEALCGALSVTPSLAKVTIVVCVCVCENGHCATVRSSVR